MSRLTLFSVRNRALVALATVFGILAGLWSASALPRELFPSLQFPVLVAVSNSPGSSSSVIEQQVSRPVEVAAQGLNGVVEVQSTSTDGFSTVIVELDYGTDLGAAQLDLQRAVLAAPGLPDDVNPQIIAGNLDDFPIIQMSASGGEEADGQDLVDRLERFVLPELEDLDGVRSASLTGVADRVVTVELDEEEAVEAGASAASVAQLLQANGVILPGGEVLDGSTELPVQVGSRLTSVEEIAALPLMTEATMGARAAATQQNTAQESAAAEAQTAADEAGQAAAADPANPELAAQSAAASSAAEQAAAADEVEVPEIPTLGDVAEVSLEEREATAYTRTNGVPSVGLTITKTPDGNAVDISRAVEEAMPDLEASLDGGELVTIFDGAPFIEKSIEDLTTEGLLGLGFAVLVVLVFLLSVRLTLVTAVSIPLSLLLTLVALSALGYSLNILTLGALTIAIGRVVDDSIVVIENIKRHAALGEDRRQAVVEATREVAAAITSATIATVAVFLPLGFVGGAVGELFRPFAVTVSLAMLASLLVALTIIPVLGFWFMRRRPAKHSPEAPHTDPVDTADPVTDTDGDTAAVDTADVPAAAGTSTEHGTDTADAPASTDTADAPAGTAGTAGTGIDDGPVGRDRRPPADAPDRLQRLYLPTLRTVLARPWITLALAAALLGGTVWGATLLRTDFIGDSGENTVQASLGMPTGTTLDETDAQAREIEEWLSEQPEVETYQATVGSSGGIEALFTGAGASTASYAITIEEGTSGQDFGQRLITTFEDDLPEGATFTATAGQAGPGSSGLEIRVQAQDSEDLRDAAEQVTEMMRASGATEVVNDLAETVPALQVEVDRMAAAEAGIAEAQLGQIVQAATDGATVGQVEFGTQQLDVVVLQGDGADVQELEELRVTGTSDEPVTLGEVADLTQIEEAVSITRIDGLRAATVTGSSTGDDLTTVTADLRDRLDALDLPTGVQVEIGGVSADQEEAFRALGLALLAAVAIVYLVMVATFNSLVQPLILLVSVPFAATGSIAALLVSGMALDVTAIIGFLMLIGIVVTNAIVLIDLVNQYRARGMDRTEAVVEGARHRLRPILMTAAATILALVPMAVAITGGSAFISQPLAIVVIGGLLSSTLLTLILVPVLYELVERAAARLGRDQPTSE